MAKRKVIRKSNRPFTYNPHYYSWGGDFKKALGGIKPFDLKGTFSGGNVAGMLKGGLASGIGSAVGNIAGGAIGGGLQSGAGSAISNIGGTIGGAVSTVNPVLGGIISAGTGIIGGLTNRMFGSKLNKENIANIERTNNAMNTVMVDNSSADSIENQWANQDFGADFSKSDIGKDGLFSSKAKKKYRQLKLQQDTARNRALTSFEDAAEAADTQSDLNAMANFAAFGGPLGIWGGYGDGAIGYELAKENLGIKALNAANKGRLTSLPNSFGSELNVFANGGPLDSLVADINRRSKADFVQRLLDSNRDYIQDWESDNIATHKLGWATDDKGAIVFPNVQRINGKLYDFTDPKNKRGKWDALNSAIERGDTLRMTPAQAEEFTKTYKKYYPKGKTFKAFGGDLLTHGAEWDNGVTVIGNGGTHEESPYEGVQMGVDNQGVPNLVEEGEVVFNDYVFSNRLTVPDAVREKYKLRGNKELTFADAAKQMQKESEERPNDPISKRGLMSAMSRLQQAQETIRQQNQVGQEGVQYAHGGKMGTLFDGFGDNPNILFPTSEEDWAKLMKTPEYGVDYDLTGVVHPFVGLSPKGITTTKKVPISPWEVLNKESKEPNNNTSKPLANNNKKNTKNPKNPIDLRYAPVVGAAIGLGQNLFSKPDYTSADAILEAANQAGNYTPIGYTPIGNYLQYRPFDRNFYLNKLNAQAGATRRAIMNNISPSRNAALLAADYNAQGRLGDLARQAEEYNLAQRQAVETFNRGTNQANAEMGLKAAMANQEAALKARSSRLSGIAQAMAVRDAVDARRGASMSANLTNLFDSLGNIGIDAYNREDRDKLIRAGVFGTLSEKPQEWSNKRWEDYKKAISGEGYSRGGKLKREEEVSHTNMYIGYIYKITNKINGKSYIGKTNNIIRRWKEHKYGHGGTSILSKAFIKYGIDNFDFSIIDIEKYNTTEELNKQLAELEIYYIGVYDTFRNGYNATIGGDGISFYKHSEKTKRKISNSNKGKIISKESLDKIRVAMLGRHHTPEVKEKIRKALLNRNHAIYEKMALKNKGKHRDHEMIMRGAAKRKKPILQYDKYGNFLKEYKGITDTGYNTTANIVACCKGKIKSAYGYIWRYKSGNTYPLHITIPNNTRAQFYKTVLQYSKEGKFIAMYDSISKASLSTGINKSAIRNCLYGWSKTAGNYVWKFKEEEINI